MLGDAPLFTAQIRYSAAAALLALTAHIAGVKIVCPRGADWLWLAAIAATGLVLFNVAVIRGVGHAEPATIAVAVACVPVVIGLAGPLLDRQRPASVTPVGGWSPAGGSACRLRSSQRQAGQSGRPCCAAGSVQRRG
jgi:drug/metabolite transporter (DMT)-like permease